MSLDTVSANKKGRLVVRCARPGLSQCEPGGQDRQSALLPAPAAAR